MPCQKLRGMVCLLSRVVASQQLAAVADSGSWLPSSLTAALCVGPCAISLRSLSLVVTASVAAEAARVMSAVGHRLTHLTLLTGLKDPSQMRGVAQAGALVYVLSEWPPVYMTLSDYLVSVGPAITSLAVSALVVVGHNSLAWLAARCPNLAHPPSGGPLWPASHQQRPHGGAPVLHRHVQAGGPI